MTVATYGPEWAKREAIRRRMRALGIVAVPPAAVLDRIVAEHETAARLERAGHDELCEWSGPDWPGAAVQHWPCYCAERHDALERVARRLDAANSQHLVSDQSVTSGQQLEEEGPR